MIILTSIFFCFLFITIPLFLLQFMTAPYYNYGLEPNRAKKQGLPAKAYPPAAMAVTHSLCSSP